MQHLTLIILWICSLWSILLLHCHGSAKVNTCFAFFRIMKGRQRYIMVRSPLVFISAIEKTYIVMIMLSACVLPLCTAAWFLPTHTHAHICLRFIIFLLTLCPIPHLNFQQFSIFSPSLCVSFLFFGLYVCLLSWVCLCARSFLCV